MVGIGSAVFTGCIFVFTSQQHKSISPAQTEDGLSVPTTTSLKNGDLSISNATLQAEQPVASEAKVSGIQNSNVSPTTLPPTQSEQIPAQTATTDTVKQTTYDYSAMRSFTDKFDDFLTDDGRAFQASGLSQKAGASGDYALAATYAEDALKIYDDLIGRTHELEIPANSADEVKTLMREAVKVHLTYIDNFRKPLQIQLSVIPEVYK